LVRREENTNTDTRDKETPRLFAGKEWKKYVNKEKKGKKGRKHKYAMSTSLV